jgi:hypothetical protein
MHSFNSLLKTDQSFYKKTPLDFRRFSWNGISFCIPKNWELSNYKIHKRKGSKIVIENEYSVKCEGEWVKVSKKEQIDRILENYTEASKTYTNHADSHTSLKNLPKGWSGTHFVFKETATTKSEKMKVFNHDLTTVFYLNEDKSLFCYFLFHFYPEDNENVFEIIENLADSFEEHSNQKFTPWVLFDLNIKTPSEYVLEKTDFDIGSKHLLFEWKNRRLFVWHFSCVNMFIKGEITAADWVLSLLKKAKVVSAINFYITNSGEVNYKRKLNHPLGSFDEIIRMCFKYKIVFKLDENKNQLFVFLFHYRKKDDMVNFSFTD